MCCLLLEGWVWVFYLTCERRQSLTCWGQKDASNILWAETHTPKKHTKLNFSNGNCTKTEIRLNTIVLDINMVLFITFFTSPSKSWVCVFACVCMSCLYLLQRAVAVGQIQSLQTVWVTQEAVQVLRGKQKHHCCNFKISHISKLFKNFNTTASIPAWALSIYNFVQVLELDMTRGGGTAAYRHVVASERVSRQVEVCEGGGHGRVGTESLTEAVYTCKKWQT